MISGLGTAPKPKKLILSINTAWNIVNFRTGLIRGLQKAGYEVVAIAPPDAYALQLEKMGCRFVACPMDNKGANPAKDVALFLRYLAILRRERPAAFLGYTIKPNVYGSLAAQRLGIPVINNVSGLGTAFIRKTWLTRVVKLLYQPSLARSARVFFQNADDRALFVADGLVAARKAVLVPGSGVDLARFSPAPSRVGAAPPAEPSTAAPPEEPPEVRERSHGLRVCP